MRATLFTTFVSATALSVLSVVVLCQPADNDINMEDIERRQIITSVDDGKAPTEPIKILWYDQKGCQGAETLTMDDSIKYGVNYDAPNVASVKTNRDIMNNEQLDFSTNPGKKRREVGTPTDADSPTLFDRDASNPHCSKFLFAAPAAPNSLTSRT